MDAKTGEMAFSRVERGREPLRRGAGVGLRWELCMKFFLTGATGYIGAAVRDALLAAGHDVIALARTGEQAQRLADMHVQPWRGDLHDPETVAFGAAQADGAIHTALARDENAPIADRAVAEAILDAYAGSGRPFIYTSGVWVMGNTAKNAGETAPLAPPPLVEWRTGVEVAVLAASGRGVRSIVIRPAVVYGRGGGLVAAFEKSARETGAAVMVGEGQNHWTFVHVDDLADLYVLALEKAPPGAVLIAASGDPVRVRDVAEAASRAAGCAGRVTTMEPDEAFKTMGPTVQGLLLDQRISGRRAMELLGWNPRCRSVLDEFRAAEESDQ